MYTICKRFRFEAAHRLPIEGHKCSGVHGHSYTVEVYLKSNTLDVNGMVKDFGDISRAWKTLKDNYDHQNLNNTMVETPTAENIAKSVFSSLNLEFPDLIGKVRVRETADCWAEYSEC